MDLLEYQGKALLRKAGVAVPEGKLARTPEEARAVASELGGHVAVKAQVRVGGRGKAGGIKLAKEPEEAAAAAEAILGMEIKGHKVRSVLVEKAMPKIEAEYYISFMLDRDGGGYLGMCSAKGGVDIEEVAASEPSAIAKVRIDPFLGFRNFHARAMASLAGLAAEAKSSFSQVSARLYEAFTSFDADLVEVNPLVLAPDGSLVALDAKVVLDDNAFFEHPDFEEFKDTFAVDPQERMAREKGLNYVKIGGSVGVIGNGAGLVMSTLDLVANAGGKAANFLDVGGGANADVVAAALEVVSSDPEVRSILVNIFGGITRCDQVAKGISEALSRIELSIPLVVRLDGTNATEGREVLSSLGDLGGKLRTADAMEEAAALAVRLAAREAG